MSIKVSGGGGGGGPSPGATDAISLEYSDWQALTSGVAANALFDTVDAGTAALWDAGSPTVVQLTAGIWLVSLSLQFENSLSTDSVVASVSATTANNPGQASPLKAVNGINRAAWALMLDAAHPLSIPLNSTANQGVSAVLNVVKLASSWRA